ncbi:MAG TPA: OmpA family protein [Panacibacter sp.]|nr:OmpA family protein [Panacibacter sp.]HNP44978.1 OmpA family protein [Panacibacter sp.]
MSRQTFDEGSIRKYTLTAFLSFVTVFCFLMLMMQCHGDFHQGSSAEVTVTPADATHSEPAAAEKPAENAIKVQLPGGIEIDALKGGIEDKLVAFLNDANSQPGKDVWFDFDNLNFKTNSAEITSESGVQVQNIVAILKAYPKLKIKIGGYTDKTGDSAANLALSQQRADALLAALTKMSANPAQLTGAEGYGSQYAKAAADAPDSEKQKDRRISLSVREK